MEKAWSPQLAVWATHGLQAPRIGDGDGGTGGGASRCSTAYWLASRTGEAQHPTRCCQLMRGRGSRWPF